MAHTDLSHAITVLLHPDRAAFEAEQRLRLFEIMRWSLLGGDYVEMKNASGVIYAAAAIACLGDDPVDGLQEALRCSETRRLLESTMRKHDFFLLLAASDLGLRPTMDKWRRGLLEDAIAVADAMLSIRQAGYRPSLGKVWEVQGATRTSGVPRFTERGRSSLGSARRHYGPQLSFTRALHMEPRPALPRYRKSKIILPNGMVAALGRHIADGRTIVFLARAKAIIELINPNLARGLKEAWADLQPAPVDSLNIRALTDHECSALAERKRRPATQTRKMNRQKPPEAVA